MGLAPEENPLLHYETRGRAMGAPALPVFAGALAAELKTRPCRLVFAHSSGKTLFGAERSLLDMLEYLASREIAPVVVLPALQNPAYLDRILRIAAAVEIVPQIWRHAGRAPHPQTVGLIRALIRKYRPQEIVVNTLVLDAPLAAARAEGVASTVHVRELPAEDAALCRGLGSDAALLRRDLLAEADRFVVASLPVAPKFDSKAAKRLISLRRVSPLCDYGTAFRQVLAGSGC